MSNGLKTFVIILFLPLIVAVGHDIYVNYYSDIPPDSDISKFEISNVEIDVKNLDIKADGFVLSDLGWIWQYYSPNSLEGVRLLIDETVWDTLIDPLLKMKASIVALFPALLGIFIICFVSFSNFSLWLKQKNSEKRAHIDYAVYGKAKDQKYHYRRK